jgi:hypothetical protein
MSELNQTLIQIDENTVRDVKTNIIYQVDDCIQYKKPHRAVQEGIIRSFTFARLRNSHYAVVVYVTNSLTNKYENIPMYANMKCRIMTCKGIHRNWNIMNNTNLPENQNINPNNWEIVNKPSSESPITGGTKSIKKYITIYFYHRPYLVTINKINKDENKVRVYTGDRHVYSQPNFLNNPLKYAEYYNKLQCSFRAKKIFIGGNKKEKGNSFLLQITKSQYVYIGKKIYQFTAMAEITKFHSPISKDDFTFPIAVDIMGNYYIMNDELIIINKKKLKLKEIDKEYKSKKVEEMDKIKMKLKRIHNPRIN